MIKMGKESKYSPAEVVERAVDFFGPSGAGLNLMDQGACCARFEGAGGYVFVQTADIDGSEGSDVTVEGREWEYQIRQFMGEI
jgi:hypothetical protein